MEHGGRACQICHRRATWKGNSNTVVSLRQAIKLADGGITNFWLADGCLLSFRNYRLRSLALATVLAVVLERFARGRMGGDVAAAVAAASDDKVSNEEQDDTATADSAAADMSCRCCCGCGCCDDRGGPAEEDCFLLSSQISLPLLSFSLLLELAGRLLLPCTAVAAQT
jgi:hypothetical protein